VNVQGPSNTEYKSIGRTKKDSLNERRERTVWISVLNVANTLDARAAGGQAAAGVRTASATTRVTCDIFL